MKPVDSCPFRGCLIATTSSSCAAEPAPKKSRFAPTAAHQSHLLQQTCSSFRIQTSGAGCSDPLSISWRAGFPNFEDQISEAGCSSFSLAGYLSFLNFLFDQSASSSPFSPKSHCAQTYQVSVNQINYNDFIRNCDMIEEDQKKKLELYSSHCKSVLSYLNQNTKTTKLPRHFFWSNKENLYATVGVDRQEKKPETQIADLPLLCCCGHCSPFYPHFVVA